MEEEKYEETILFKKVKNSSDTDKIKYILYSNKQGLNSKEIAKIQLSYYPINPISPIGPIKKNSIGQEGQLGQEGHEDSHKISLFVRDTLNKYLKRLLDRKDLERDESVKPYVYKLSKATRLNIDNELEREETRLHEKFLEIKRQEEDKNYFESSLSFWKDYSAKHGTGKKDFIIDLKILFDEAKLVTFEILNYFFDKPEEQLEFAKISYNNLFNIKPDIILKGKLSDTKRLKDLRNEKTLISVECQLDFKTDILKFKQIVNYECPSCGTKHIQNNNDYFLRESIKPLTYCSCGRKGRLKEISIKSLDYQKLLISDLDINLLSGEQKVIKNAIIKNNLVNPIYEKTLNIGDKIQVIGILKDYTLEDKDCDIKTYFEVLGFEFLEKVDFDNKISDEEKKDFFDLANSGELIKRFSDSLFCKHKGDCVAKKLSVLQMFTGFKQDKDRESLHLLLFGEPGTGKSHNFLERINSFYPRTSKIAQNNNTSAGLGVASMKNDFLGKNIIELGAVPKANKGYLLIDELNDINQDLYGNCIEAMESCSVTSNKAGAKGTFPADIKILATMNPLTDSNLFDKDLNLFSQNMGMSGKFVDRFDFVIPFVDKDKSIISKIRSRREVENNKPEFDDFFLKKYLLFSESINPFFRDSLQNQFEDVFSIFGERDLKLSKQSGHRIIRKCENLVKAVARIHLSSTVEPLHIKIAGDIYNEYLDLIETFGVGSVVVEGVVTKLLNKGEEFV